MAALAKTLEEAEDKLDEIDQQRKRRLEGLTSASSQVERLKRECFGRTRDVVVFFNDSINRG